MLTEQYLVSLKAGLKILCFDHSRNYLFDFLRKILTRYDYFTLGQGYISPARN